MLQEILNEKMENMLAVDCREIKRNTLTRKDMVSVTELFENNRPTTEEEIIKLAQKIVSTKKRNKRIEDNEERISYVMELVDNYLEYGSITTYKALYNAFKVTRQNSDKGITTGAVTVAVDRLIKNGTLRKCRISVKRKDVRGRNFYTYTDGYKKIC